MIDFVACFLPTFEFSLNDIHYKKLDISNSDSSEKQLNCIDTIKAELVDPRHVCVEYTRELNFSTQDIFELSVTFGALYTINEDSDQNIDWNNIDISAELLKSGAPVLNVLTSRISLLISQITSSYGQPPVVTPPTLIQNTK